MVYLLISICISSFLFVIFKLFDVLKINTFQAIVVNYFTAAVLGFFLSNNLVSFQEIPNQPWFFGAFLLGIMFILVFNVMALTSQKMGYRWHLFLVKCLLLLLLYLESGITRKV